MTIEKTMNDRDVKLVGPNNLTPEQKAKWDAAYDPKIKAFKEANPQGKDLVRWKYRRYMEDYLAHRLVDERWAAGLPQASGLADNTLSSTSDRGLPGRPRLVRQAIHVRGVLADAVAGPASGGNSCGGGE
jgi:hypothetical protein